MISAVTRSLNKTVQACCLFVDDMVAKIGSAIAARKGLSTAGGKLVKDSAGGSSAGTFGFARGTTTADGDFVLIYFKTQ